MPLPDAVSQPFFDAAAAGRLAIQHCPACDRHIAPTRPRCPWCAHPPEWRQVSGAATLYTFAVVHQVLHPGLHDRVPYATALVDLAEGVRLHAQLVDVEASEIRIGMPLTVCFRTVPSDTGPITIPYFRPA